MKYLRFILPIYALFAIGCSSRLVKKSVSFPKFRQKRTIQMSTYFDQLTPGKQKRIALAISAMQKRGITNHYAMAGILAVMSKESNFELRSEIGYGNTPNKRIREVFGKRLSAYTEDGLDTLKKNDHDFFEAVYGGTWGAKNLGNTVIGDGYKFRGRGLNQLTGRGNYAAYGKMSGYDLIGNPDLLSNTTVAIDVAIAYMIDHINHAPALQRTAYNFTTMNDFTNTTDAANAAYNANAGWGKSPTECKADTTGGYVRTHARVRGFLKMVM